MYICVCVGGKDAEMVNIIIQHTEDALWIVLN